MIHNKAFLKDHVIISKIATCIANCCLSKDSQTYVYICWRHTCNIYLYIEDAPHQRSAFTQPHVCDFEINACLCDLTAVRLAITSCSRDFLVCARKVCRVLTNNKWLYPTMPTGILKVYWKSKPDVMDLYDQAYVNIQPIYVFTFSAVAFKNANIDASFSRRFPRYHNSLVSLWL